MAEAQLDSEAAALPEREEEGEAEREAAVLPERQAELLPEAVTEPLTLREAGEAEALRLVL